MQMYLRSTSAPPRALQGLPDGSSALEIIAPIAVCAGCPPGGSGGAASVGSQREGARAGAPARTPRLCDTQACVDVFARSKTLRSVASVPQAAQAPKDLPFGLYLLFSSFVAIAAVRSCGSGYRSYPRVNSFVSCPLRRMCSARCPGDVLPSVGRRYQTPSPPPCLHRLAASTSTPQATRSSASSRRRTPSGPRSSSSSPSPASRWRVRMIPPPPCTHSLVLRAPRVSAFLNQYCCPGLILACCTFPRAVCVPLLPLREGSQRGERARRQDRRVLKF